MLKYNSNIEKIEFMTLPMIPMRAVVAFPNIPISCEIVCGAAIKSCEEAAKNDSMVMLVTQKNGTEDNPNVEDLAVIGVTAKIKQFVRLPDNNVRIVAEGILRAKIESVNILEDKSVYYANIVTKDISLSDDGGIKGEALILEVMTIFDRFQKYIPKLSDELLLAVKALTAPGLIADFIAGNILIKNSDKLEILEIYEPLKRIEKLAVIMERELEILETEVGIHKKVRSQIEHNQRDYYLREQLKVIQGELGYEGGADSDTEEYYEKIIEAALPEEVETKLVKEAKKLIKMSSISPESALIKNYLDVCLELPWKKLSKDTADIVRAENILNRDHDGLEKIKERIIEFLAVKQLNPHLNNQILCLVGPPGTGKTSIVASIARSMKRKYVRVSLGGIRDESDIRGHRKTYVGAMPGRIINALIQAGTRNPVILLDEIDKLTCDSRGDPASALLEVLDSEQNKLFRDHFIELPMDLSECLFIATANTAETIPRPLIDRMDLIELKIYTRHEKFAIAKNHLIPKQITRHGLNKRQLKIEESAVYELIDFYTREAGVRNLEREIAALCRKAAREIIEAKSKSIKITQGDIAKYLGKRKIKPDHISDIDEIGVVNGLAYTELGGDILKIEVSAMQGTGKIELTGSLGDVMKESARTAVSYIRANAGKLGIDPDFYKTKDLHIHVPEGAVPKDGPSAGVTIATALTSELSGTPVRRDIAMTGEITLRGKVLPIGGLREKTMAAYKAGVLTVLVPHDNADDLDDIDPIVKNGMKFIECTTISDVLSNALISQQSGR